MSEKRSEIVRPIIYRECLLKHFPTTVKSEYKPADFIIGFASEDYNPNGVGTGNFHPTWDPASFTPENVKKLKETYPHVRVMISIGGDMGSDSPFNPNEKQAWIVAAVNSLREIIHIFDDDNQKNMIDGIDIHYDEIKSSAHDFSYCIGEVIKSLKSDRHLTIKVVSIAPGEYTQVYYYRLYIENQNYIDLVDYLFTDWGCSMEDLVKLYKKLLADYSHAALLPGYLNPSFLGDKTKEAALYLVTHNLAPGFFTYPANDDSHVEEDASKHI
ncbi:unnamed protein product [Lathyrus oleraceus]|nr:chitinase 2-like [Pisum sativum]